MNKNNKMFVVKVKYTKQLEDGTFKRVTEPYLIESLTYTDAEATIYEELASTIRGEFSIVNISIFDVRDVFVYLDSEIYWKAKVQFESYDDSERVKKCTLPFLITADNLDQAQKRIVESLENSLSTFKIISIQESPIVDYFQSKTTDNEN